MKFSSSGSWLLVSSVFSWQLPRLNLMTLNFGTGSGVCNYSIIFNLCEKLCMLAFWFQLVPRPRHLSITAYFRLLLVAIFVWTFNHRSYCSVYLSSIFRLCPSLPSNVCFNSGPTFFITFCSGCKEAEAADAADENVRCAGGFQKFRTILHGLADCLTCFGNGIEVSH